MTDRFRRRDNEDDDYELPSIVRPSPNPQPPAVLAQQTELMNCRDDQEENGEREAAASFDEETTINRPEVSMMQEVVPSIDLSVILEILHGNDYDLDKSIDAALALMTSLAAEEGKAVLSDMRSFSDDTTTPLRPNGPTKADGNSSGTISGGSRAGTRTGSGTGDNIGSSSSGMRSSSSNADLLKQTSRHRSPRVVTPTTAYIDTDLEENVATTHSTSGNNSKNRNSSTSNNINNSINSKNSNNSNSGNSGSSGGSNSRAARSPQVGNRGPPVILSDRFLAIPRYRLVVDQHTDESTDFTVAFRRKNEKLGITIQENDGEIAIHTVHQKGPFEPLLAMEAGIKVGDVLTGINSEYFSPGAEVQDVIDILQLAGTYVTLHFTRRYAVASTGAGGESPRSGQYHKFAHMLLDQTVIGEERAVNVSKAMHRLKERVLQWDSGFITERIELWKLDAGLAAGHARSSSSSGGSSHISAHGLVHSTSNSTLFSSLGNLATISAKDSGAGSSGRKSDLVVCTRNLRPAVSIRLMRAEERQDHVVYVIWVMDVKSGAEWYVRRRFREFYEFRDSLVGIRPAIGRIEFPSKRLNVAEIGAMVSERLDLLQKFLRKVSSLVCVNSLHPSTAKVQLALQHFLEVTDRMENIAILESRQPVLSEKNMVQVFVHSVMQMACMDKVLSGFIDTFNEGHSFEVLQGKSWTDVDGRKALNQVKDFLDNLQTVLCDAIVDDCLEIMRKYHKERVGGSSSAGQDGARKPGHRNGFRYIDARSSASSSLASSSSSSREQNDPGAGCESHPGQGDGRGGHDDHDDVLLQCSEDELRSQVRSAVRRQVEIEVYVPCSLRLWAALERAFAPAETSLRRNILAITHQPQSFFGIPVQHISPSSWDEVVFSLRDVRSKTLPHDRLEALLAAAKHIPDLFIKEHPGADQPLGADDFLPIFIYVLARSQIPELMALNEELQALCDSDKRMSETGYYLATLEASLQHIAEADVTAESDVLFPMLNQPPHQSFSDDDDDEEEEEEEEKDEISGKVKESSETNQGVDVSANMEMKLPPAATAAAAATTAAATAITTTITTTTTTTPAVPTAAATLLSTARTSTTTASIAQKETEVAHEIEVPIEVSDPPVPVSVSVPVPVPVPSIDACDRTDDEDDEFAEFRTHDEEEEAARFGATADC